MKFAIIRTGGKQYPVSEGKTITIEKLDAKEGGKVSFSDVLLYADGKQVVVGRPTVSKATVSGTLTKQFRGPKVRVVKYKNKTRYQRTKGHRQSQSKVEIKTIKLA